MSDLRDELQTIKHKLINENKIEDLLSSIGCEHIRTEQRGFLITAQLPERFYSTNRRAVQVKTNDFLNSSIRNRGFSGDIFNLVSYLYFDKRNDEVQKDLSNARDFICETFGWTEFQKGRKGMLVKKDYTACLKEIIKGKKRRQEIKPNPVLPETVLNEFYFKGKPLPFKKWIDEGISYKTQMMYGIGFDDESKRITIPMRNRFGQLVGVKGRIMKDEDDDRKYLYLYRYSNRYEWFNWHIAHPNILLQKKVYIFEAEKSPMKAYDHNILNTLGIGSSEISPEQAQMIKQLGLDIQIIFCFDKGIKKKDIEKTVELFQGRECFLISDEGYELLDEKNAPIDQGIDTFNNLIENFLEKVDN